MEKEPKIPAYAKASASAGASAGKSAGKKKSKWLIPTIIVVGIIVLGLGSWAGYNHWLKSKNTQQSSQEQSKDEFGQWKIYKNEKYGFEFKSPAFMMQRISETDNRIEFKHRLDSSKNYISTFGILIIEDIGKVSLQEWFSKNIDYKDILVKSGKFKLVDLLGGGKAYQIQDISMPAEYLNGGEPVEDYYIMPNSQNYVLIFSRSQDHDLYLRGYTSEKTRELFDQILFTFRFIEPSATSEWRIYRNGIYDVEVKYPDVFLTGEENMVIGGKCDYQIFPDKCPNIDNILIENNLESRENLQSSNYWSTKALKVDPVNGINFCLSSTNTALGIIYYYTTVKDNQCVILRLVVVPHPNCKKIVDKTIFSQCERDILNKPNIVEKILSTFKFIEPIDISDWQTYRNEKYGFELKYPKDWRFEDVNTGFIDIEQSDENEVVFYHLHSFLNKEGKKLEMIDAQLRVISANKKAGDLLDETLKKFCTGWGGFCGQVPEKLTIDNHSAFKVMTGYEGAPADRIFLEKNENSSFLIDKAWQYGYQDFEDDVEITNIFDTMISTFKFIN